MSGLVLKLGPRERILVNGAVIENGDRRSRLAIVTPDANVLRLRDSLSLDQATTPLRRVCYAVQQVLAGQVDEADMRAPLLRWITDLEGVFADPDGQSVLLAAKAAVRDDQHYQCLRLLRALLPQEEALSNRQTDAGRVTS